MNKIILYICAFLCPAVVYYDTKKYLYGIKFSAFVIGTPLILSYVVVQLEMDFIFVLMTMVITFDLLLVQTFDCIRLIRKNNCGHELTK